MAKILDQGSQSCGQRNGESHRIDGCPVVVSPHEVNPAECEKNQQKDHQPNLRTGISGAAQRHTVDRNHFAPAFKAWNYRIALSAGSTGWRCYADCEIRGRIPVLV